MALPLPFKHQRLATDWRTDLVLITSALNLMRVNKRNSTQEKILLLGLIRLQAITKTVATEWLLDDLHKTRLVFECSFQWEVCISQDVQLISTCWAACLAAGKKPMIKCFPKMNLPFIRTGWGRRVTGKCLVLPVLFCSCLLSTSEGFHGECEVVVVQCCQLSLPGENMT